MSASDSPALRVRTVRAGDLAQVTAIDLEITRLPKPGYWAQIYVLTVKLLKADGNLVEHAEAPSIFNCTGF